MSRNLYYIPVLFLVLLIAQPASAGVYSDTQLNTLNYNLDIVMSAVDFYYADTGSMPSSVSDLYYAGWIPANLKNPLTGGNFNYNATDASGGDITLTSLGNECIFSCLSPTGDVTEISKFTSEIDGSLGYGPDLVMKSYQLRLIYTMLAYWSLENDIPYSIDDLVNTGIWPFDGSETNPFSGAPLNFYGHEPGDIYFAVGSKEAKFTIYYSGNSVGFANLNPDYMP